jgi:pantetheine-phosphate adenylyltransferase
MNRQLAPEVETIFLMTNEDNFFVSSSLVREVAQMGGNIARVVPPVVAEALKKKLRKRR